MVSLGSFTYFATTTTCFFHSENLTQPSVQYISISQSLTVYNLYLYLNVLQYSVYIYISKFHSVQFIHIYISKFHSVQYVTIFAVSQGHTFPYIFCCRPTTEP